MSFLSKIVAAGTVQPTDPSLWKKLCSRVDVSTIDASEDELVTEFNDHLKHGTPFEEIVHEFAELAEDDGGGRSEYDDGSHNYGTHHGFDDHDSYDSDPNL